MERAKFLMEENIYREINLNAIGEVLGVSTSHLNAVFKSYTAMTPYQYFMNISKVLHWMKCGQKPFQEKSCHRGSRAQVQGFLGDTVRGCG